MKVGPCLRTTYARRTACTRKRRGALAPHGHYAGRGSSRDKHVCSPNLSVADIASYKKTELRICPLKPNYCTSHVGNAQRVFLSVPCSSCFSLVMPIHLFSRLDTLRSRALLYTAQHATYMAVHTSIDLLRIRVRL